MNAAPAWKYPGVPYTDWAYDPFTYPVPARPVEWPSGDKVGIYFIEKDNLTNATDTILPGDHVDVDGMRYGYPDRPRLTLPITKWNGSGPHAAGTVFWIKGGIWDTVAGSKNWKPIFLGTPEAPCWIYGDPDDKPVLTSLGISTPQSTYFFIENLVWDDTDHWNYCVTSASKGFNGQTHHGAIRNCRVQNKHFTGNIGYFTLSPAQTSTDGDVHDMVYYKNTVKNCGGGYKWADEDGDAHAFHIYGYFGSNRVYRAWVVGNTIIPGDTPDPIDGYFKSVSGNMIQIGTEGLTGGNADHVFIAGNSCSYSRQAAVGLKRSSDIIASSNHFGPILSYGVTVGSAMNLKYDQQDNWWFIANTVNGAQCGLMRGTTINTLGKGAFNPDDTRVYVVGNVFKNLDLSAQSEGWRTHGGVSIWDLMGKVYIVNNTVDHSIYGVYSLPIRQNALSELHIYNNIFTNINDGGGVDPRGGRGLYIGDRGFGMQLYVKNNLFDDFQVVDGAYTYTDPTIWNSNPIDPPGIAPKPDTEGNLKDSPLYVNAAGYDYRLRSGSPGIDQGTRHDKIDPANDVYQLFVNAFSNDPDFPGKPSDVWPRDLLGKPRVMGSSIDMGPHEHDPTRPSPPGEPPTVEPLRP